MWPHSEFPLIQAGKLTFNRNPRNYFAEVEQLAFSPAHLVPGIEPSPDKMLQGRLFSYSDTHRHRLGANYLQIPVNCPYRTQVSMCSRVCTVGQLAFSLGHLVPGNKYSPDKMLQARFFSYSNTHRHYLGANYLQIPVNCPYHAHVVCWLLIFFAKQYINSITHFYSIMISGQELSKRRPNDSRYKPRRMPQLLSQFLWWT